MGNPDEMQLPILKEWARKKRVEWRKQAGLATMIEDHRGRKRIMPIFKLYLMAKKNAVANGCPD